MPSMLHMLQFVLHIAAFSRRNPHFAASCLLAGRLWGLEVYGSGLEEKMGGVAAKWLALTSQSIDLSLNADQQC